MSSRTVLAVADEILEALTAAEPGHCLRIDYLDRAEARDVCRVVRERASELGVDVFLLNGADGPAEMSISTDRAIELRNRKRRSLCLLVPSDLVDPAASSLANSFAVLDGRELHRRALHRFVADLPDQTRDVAIRVLGQLQHLSMVSDDWKLEFVAEAKRLASSGEQAKLGLELWRVGLVADSGADFSDRLDRNRRAVQGLTKPLRATASAMDRLLNLGLDGQTVSSLRAFFRMREMQAVRTWSQALAEGAGPTFDKWTPVEGTASELRALFVRSFVDKDGVVETYCRLSQPDGAGGPLFATVGQKAAVVVRWVTEPVSPRDVHRWRVEVITSSERDQEASFDLPAVEVAGSKRTARLSFDFALDEEVDFGVRIRVTPLDLAGSEIALNESSGSVEYSDEFFLAPEASATDTPLRETRRESPSIAFGRLETAVSFDSEELIESQPQWSSRDLEYFTLRMNERRLVSVGVSRFLREAQTDVLTNPKSGGRYVLETEGLVPASFRAARLVPLERSEQGPWGSFVRARESFFGRVRKAAPRDTIETADWSVELAGHALRYAQAYIDLLNEIEDQSELVDALSLDSILLKPADEDENGTEEALVVLPTHPARVAWMAGYTQLLRGWEEQVLGVHGARMRTLDLPLIRTLAPSNVPPFMYHPESRQVFCFLENVRFSTGIALPAETPDPYRRLSDVSVVLGMRSELAVVADTRPRRLQRHLERYAMLHPHTPTLKTLLVNPDQGELFSEAVLNYLSSLRGREESPRTPRLDVTAFVTEPRRATLAALERLREFRADDPSPEPGNALQPGVAATIRDMATLRNGRIPSAHMAVVSDFTSPSVRASEIDDSMETSTSLSLYGLLARFVATSERDVAGMKWKYRILLNDAGIPVPHPAGPRYSDTMFAMHTALSSAVGRKLAPQSSNKTTAPAVEVTLSAAEESILEGLHRSVDWVITLDRYFGIDYYDSPYSPYLAGRAQKYLIDYSPELAEGQGHRVMVTTGWRDEIQAVLQRALVELGFNVVDRSVGRLLHYLKTVSGRLALEALGTTTSATAAASLGVVTAWLQRQGRLSQALLIPVDLHPRLISARSEGPISEGERRCDLALITLRRGIVEATFVEVKWRQGKMPIDGLVVDIVAQTRASAEAMRERFFNEERFDGALQRAHFATVLKFYLDRALRYELFDASLTSPFLDHIARLERTGLQFRPSYEGYIVSLADEPRRPIIADDARITILTARDFESSDDFGPSSAPAAEVTKAPTTTAAAGSEPSTKPAVAEGKAEGEEAVAADVGAAPGKEDASTSVAIILGAAQGGPVLWTPSVRGSPHAFFTGIPGQGKSWALIRMVRGLAGAAVPSLVFDFHGQFAAEESMNRATANGVVMDVSRGLPFSPFECASEPGPADWRGNAYAISEIFGYVVGLGDIQRDVVYTAVRDAYRAAGFLEDGTAGTSFPTLPDVLARIESTERSRRVSNVSARCRPLLEMNLFRPDADSERLIESIRHGMIVDLSKLYLESIQIAACAFLLRKVYKDMLRWAPVDQLRLAVVVDEAHRLARDITLPKLMKEGRKFGIAVLVASQGVSDFHPDVLANAGSKIIFRTNFPESRRVAGFLRPRPGLNLVAAIEQLSVGEAYVQTPEMSYASLTAMAQLTD